MYTCVDEYEDEYEDEYGVSRCCLISRAGSDATSSSEPCSPAQLSLIRYVCMYIPTYLHLQSWYYEKGSGCISHCTALVGRASHSLTGRTGRMRYHD